MKNVRNILTSRVGVIFEKYAFVQYLIYLFFSRFENNSFKEKYTLVRNLDDNVIYEKNYNNTINRSVGFLLHLPYVHEDDSIMIPRTIQS